MLMWLDLAPIFVLLLCINAEDHIKHEPCRDRTVCVIFVNDKCTTATTKMDQQPQDKGYIWKNHTATPCKYASYGYLYARLDIEPLSATEWKVVAILFTKRESEEAYKPEQYVFSFTNGETTLAELTFPNANNSQFLYAQDGILKPSSHKTMENNGTITSADQFLVFGFTRKEFSFVRFSFEIDADGKNLIDFFGPIVVMALPGNPGIKIMLNDTAFPEQLKLLIPESKSEGMTAQAKMLLGFGICFGVLVLFVAAVIIVWYLRKKGKIGAKATIRDSDSKAQTPGSTRRSCPAMAPAYTPPAPYELANPYEAPVPPLPK